MTYFAQECGNVFFAHSGTNRYFLYVVIDKNDYVGNVMYLMMRITEPQIVRIEYFTEG